MTDFLSHKPLPLDLPGHAVIDVTLRDGGFRTGFHWSELEVAAVLRGSAAARFNWVEIGYVGGVPDMHNRTDAGRHAALTCEDISRIKSLAVDNGDSLKLAVMVHPSSSGPNLDFVGLKSAGADMVRLVFHDSWHETAFKLHRDARASGLQTALNIALISRYSSDERRRLTALIAAEAPDILYLADTCGSLLPSDVHVIFTDVATDIDSGFHGHDFLCQAVPNSISALSAGCRWIDVSWLGLGRGAGNTRAEIWSAIQCRATGYEFPFDQIQLTLSTLLVPLGPQPMFDLPAIVSGMNNWTPPQEDRFRASIAERNVQ